MEKANTAPRALQSETSYRDFLYSVTLKKENDAAKAFELSYGKVGEGEGTRYWKVTLDFQNDTIAIGNQDKVEIKSAEYDFEDSKEYRVNILSNDGLAKVYVNDSEWALLVYATEGYEGGKVEDNLEASQLTYSKDSIVNLLPNSGDVFIGGYTLYRVVNLGDGNYPLKEGDYTVNRGVITINDSYLRTLETNSQYKFRAVTSLTDFDFYVKTGEVGTQVVSSTAKYYVGDEARFELSETSKVSKVLIDQEEVAFTQNQNLDVVTIAPGALSSIPSGEHTIKFFTENGRPETKFSLYSSVEIIPPVPAPVSHLFFYIDIAIFAVLIGGYVTFSLLSKRKKQ